MSMKDRIQSEALAAHPITNDDMVCKDCNFKDTGPNSGVCEKYPFNYSKGLTGKPNEIINGGKCDFYKKS